MATNMLSVSADRRSLKVAPIFGLVLLIVLVDYLAHAVVDASLGRVLAIIGFGLVMGLLARWLGWQAAALAHALANTLAMAVGLIASGGNI